jgi:serine phosphatase RsbU (regulator of sigma subunit)/CheY-like chemotaxis protein
VLVVDDDSPSREVLCNLLVYRGHQVREASDGGSALTLAATYPPDAVITDVLMPGLDGYELARALRGMPSTQHVPIAFSTAKYGPEEIRPMVDAFGIHDVIFKPANPTAVLEVIDSLLIPRQVPVLAADQVTEVLQLTRSGMWTFEPATNTIVVSPELRDLLGLSSTRLALDELTRRVHPDDLTAITTNARITSRTGKPGVVEMRVAGTDGMVHELIVSCRATPPRGSLTASRPLWGVAQDVTRIRDDLRNHMRVQADWHAVHRTVDAFHRAVLPVAPPTIPGVGLAAVYLPAPQRLDIGAAWHDAVPVDGGRILLSVGKVAGHDRCPAAVMGQILAALRVYAHGDPDPVGVLTRLNRFLIDTGEDDTFATAVVALFDPGTGRLRVANGGHPAPLLVSAERSGEAIAALVGPAGPALGILSEAEFPKLNLYLAPGAAYCAYTDGLVDNRSGPASADTHRLQRVAEQAFGRFSGDDPDRLPVAQLLAESIVGDMLGGATPDDDVCLSVLRAEADGA